MHAEGPVAAALDRTMDRARAYREAALRTEVRRAYAVLTVVALSTLLVILRVTKQGLDPRLVLAGASGFALLLGLQLVVLVAARRALASGRMLPTWFIVLTVVLESTIPTAMMAYHIATGTLAPYASLSSPPILAYGLMLSLTTLRLRPGLCLLAGATAAAGYAGLLAYTVFGLGLAEPTTGLPPVAYVNSALLILISGVGAAWAAREVRGHFEAALREAETRRRMARIEHDLEVARTIQQALLPRGAPDLPGYEIAGWNQPADQTGGDYYDWQRMPDGCWLVTLADVSGHGIGPALVTAACRAYMRGISEHHDGLASLASRLNGLLSEDLPEGRFVTMASVRVDPSGGPATLLSAGHGPIVLLVGATGEVRDILPGDLPLAIVPDASFGPEQTVTLAPGDVLALVTDGFVEWARHDEHGRREEFGIGRLRESLRRHAALAGPDLIRAIAADAAAFASPRPQEDDLTMVIIRRKGEPSRAGTR